MIGIGPSFVLWASNLPVCFAEKFRTIASFYSRNRARRRRFHSGPPRGSGVLVFSRHAARGGYGILTAAHVMDEFRAGSTSGRLQVVSPSMFHRSPSLRPLTLQRTMSTYVVRIGPQDDITVAPDLAWVSLAMEDVRSIQRYGGVFFDLDRNRHQIPSEPQHDVSESQALPRTGAAVMVGVLGYNYRTGQGPESTGTEVPFNLLCTICGDARDHRMVPDSTDWFDFEVISPTKDYGSAGDPVTHCLAPTTWKGMSGAGYWQLVFGGPDDPVPFEARLEGIVFAQLDRRADGSRGLRANGRSSIQRLLREGKRRHDQRSIPQ